MGTNSLSQAEMDEMEQQCPAATVDDGMTNETLLKSGAREDINEAVKEADSGITKVSVDIGDGEIYCEKPFAKGEPQINQGQQCAQSNSSMVAVDIINELLSNLGIDGAISEQDAEGHDGIREEGIVNDESYPEAPKARTYQHQECTLSPSALALADIIKDSLLQKDKTTKDGIPAQNTVNIGDCESQTHQDKSSTVNTSVDIIKEALPKLQKDGDFNDGMPREMTHNVKIAAGDANTMAQGSQHQQCNPSTVDTMNECNPSTVDTINEFLSNLDIDLGIDLGIGLGIDLGTDADFHKQNTKDRDRIIEDSVTVDVPDGDTYHDSSIRAMTELEQSTQYQQCAMSPPAIINELLISSCIAEDEDEDEHRTVEKNSRAEAKTIQDQQSSMICPVDIINESPTNLLNNASINEQDGKDKHGITAASVAKVKSFCVESTNTEVPDFQYQESLLNSLAFTSVDIIKASLPNLLKDTAYANIRDVDTCFEDATAKAEAESAPNRPSFREILKDWHREEECNAQSFKDAKKTLIKKKKQIANVAAVAVPQAKQLAADLGEFGADFNPLKKYFETKVVMLEKKEKATLSLIAEVDDQLKLTERYIELFKQTLR